MKDILIVYDRMMTGGTTSALISLLEEFNYDEYNVDLLLFDLGGEFVNSIPKEVHVLAPAFNEHRCLFSVSKLKLIFTILNGGVAKSIAYYIKYRKTSKGNLRLILMHSAVNAQVLISQRVLKRYDVAIGFMEGWADHYVISRKVKAKKRIVWFHPDYENSYLIPECDMKVLKKADSVVVVSTNCLKEINKIFPQYAQKTYVVENITSKHFVKERASQATPQIGSATINLITVARCDISVKGLDRILLALERLKKENILFDTVWHYIGGGPELPALKKMVENLGLTEHVKIYGQMNNPLVYLKQMDAFILASRYEGKPVSVEEALALGVPCLVSNYASASEQIRSCFNGLIAENTEDGIYQIMKEYISNNELRKAMREYTKSFYKERQDAISKLDELIKGVGNGNHD